MWRSRQAGTRVSVARISVTLTLAVMFVLAGATSALAITRGTVLDRAQAWVNHPVPYSQAKYHLGYRTDCSGYVSACWATGISWSTATFHAVTHKIAKNELKPGDAMLKKGYHIRLFHNWVDSAHTRYVAYEAGTKVAVARVHSLAVDLAAGYVPTRYNGILDGPASNNVIWNGAFDAWVQDSWGADSAEPVMWDVTGADYETLAVQRTDIYHSAGSSLQLLNPSADAQDTTELSQIASVTPGVRYQLVAWAESPSDPAALTLAVDYLSADGQSIAQSSTAGDACGVNASAFAQMSAPTTAPAGAVNARVTVTLAGGTTDNADGTSAFIDDVSLTCPQVASSIRASATSLRSGRTLVLTGSVTPTSAVGATAVVYAQRPKGSWKRMAIVPITASGSAAVWRATYKFSRAMRKGIYHFKTVVPALPGYVGSTTRIVSVTLK